jgi:hypothetical protein
VTTEILKIPVEKTLFWTDNWIDGTSIPAMAPALFGRC